MSRVAPPTERQLRYLRTLATRTATTFAPPSSRRGASQEIQRLLAFSRAQQGPPMELEEGDTFEDVYATAVHPDEVSGFGSSATWRSQQAQVAPDSAGPPRPVRLLAYRAGAAERLLVAERRGARLYITDVPARGDGPRYPVEELDASEGLGPLRGLVEDYKARARELGEIPMAAGALVETLGVGAHDG